MATGRVPTTANSPLTAKGDLFGYSTTQARVPVGNDGETLVADSSTSTGLRWGSNYGFTAGKNKLINGDFRINQRSFSSTTNDATFTFDRWVTYTSGTDQTYTAQTFTPGTAPVAGYEGVNFLQVATTGGANKFAIIIQRIEDVRTFANQTATVSFWAKANSGTPKVQVTGQQFFGTGGSSTVDFTPQEVTISTTWARYSITFAIPSISGKTIGTGSYLNMSFVFNNAFNGAIGQQTNTFQFWGAQMEAGSVATAFQTATGTLAGELYACKRYYQKMVRDNSVAIGNSHTAGVAYCPIFFEEEMRVAPTITFATAGQTTGTITFLAANGNYPTTTGTHAANNITVNGFVVYASGYAGFTAGGITSFYSTGSSTVYTASAEL